MLLWNYDTHTVQSSNYFITNNFSKRCNHTQLTLGCNAQYYLQLFLGTSPVLHICYRCQKMNYLSGEVTGL